jgi:alpha-tubulin suppressor-like RCC1 family protein
MSRRTDIRTRTHALAWGYNNLGGLGTGTTARALYPSRAAAVPEGTLDLQGGTDFTVALTKSGEVWTWGGNARGQLGTDAGRSSRIASRVELPRIASISVGENHVLAVTADGHLYGWGDNRHTQITAGTHTEQTRPAEIAAIGRGARVATGNVCSMMIDPRGRVTIWGKQIPGTTPVADARFGAARSLGPATTAGAEQVDAGLRHVVVLTGDGELRNYGLDIAGKPLREKLELTQAWGRISGISAGDNHSVALTERGTVLTWGANYHGQLGLRDLKFRRHPVVVRMPTSAGRVVSVAAAGDSTFVRTEDHAVYAWGHGAFGQHGNGTSADQTRPEPVTLPEDLSLASIHVGRYHAIALTH